MQVFLTALLSAALAANFYMTVRTVAWSNRSRSLYFAGMALYLCVYTLGYMLELYCITREAAMIALSIQSLAAPMIAPFFLLTALALFRPGKMRTWMLPGAMAYGIAVFLTVLLNEYHMLYYTSLEIAVTGGYYHTAYQYGPLYYLQQAVNFYCVLYAHAVLFRKYTGAVPALKRQMAVFLAGSLIGFGSYILYFTGAWPGWVDIKPLTLTICLYLFSVTLFRHRLLGTVSAAFNDAVESMDDALIVLDVDWRFLHCNESAKRLFPSIAGFTGTEPIFQADGWPEHLAPGAGPGMAGFQREIDGREHAYRAGISKITNPRGKLIGWSLVIRDMTDLYQIICQLEEIAVTDSLTGIYNRRQFTRLAERELALAQRHGLSATVMIFDLDHFKYVNDTYGHAAGDQVLRAAAESVKRELRFHDLFARYGGEEFVILTTTEEGSDPLGFAQRLCSAVKRAYVEHDGHRISVSASFGVVKAPPGANLTDAVAAADRAMYRAKALGRDRVVMGDMAREDAGSPMNVFDVRIEKI